MGATVIIMVCVNVVVLLIVMILNIVYRRKYNKTTGVSSVNMEKTDNGINREHCHGDGDYDEINNGPPQSDTDCTTTTSPSDSIYYASVNFHKDAEFPNEATAVISKEETSSSDYATVNVGQSSTDSTVNHPCSSSGGSSHLLHSQQI
ncbi:hypothetical protein UPYG_G00059380 [Umbra pygmaea]|uniref:Uncharacterized protein n=1 Tax=Umbra pygmaea TaxID=75934 RepID=A0ABD0XYG5_UMBPY